PRIESSATREIRRRTSAAVTASAPPVRPVVTVGAGAGAAGAGTGACVCMPPPPQARAPATAIAIQLRMGAPGDGRVGEKGTPSQKASAPVRGKPRTGASACCENQGRRRRTSGLFESSFLGGGLFRPRSGSARRPSLLSRGGLALF